ncbi:MAG: hypothetical protein AAGI63_13495 [Planctomycetota bacterium]
MIETLDDRHSGSRKRRDRQRTILGLTLFGCTSAVLLFIIWDGKRYQTQVNRAIDDQTVYLAELKQEESKRRRAEEQAKKDKYLVFQYLKECRDADDFPELTGSLVFSQHRGDRGLALWVPEGLHELRVTAKISTRRKQEPDTNVRNGSSTNSSLSSEDSNLNQSTPNANEAGGTTAWSQPETESLEWNVPLQGSSGYLLELDSKSSEEPLRWTITSNAAAFKARTEQITTDAFKPSSWSYSDSNKAFSRVQSLRPNQIQGTAVSEQPSEGVEVFNLSLASSRQETKMTVELRARIVTLP